MTLSSNSLAFSSAISDLLPKSSLQGLVNFMYYIFQF